MAMRFEAIRSASLSLLLVLWVTAPAAAQRGAITNLAVTPGAARTGMTISAAVTGLNPCGAVFIDWGDGTAITHPIVDLPTTHTHAYSLGGSYTIRARGMGNCDGDLTATVRIEGPGPGTQSKLTGFSVASPGGQDESVRMRMEGQGTCNVSVEFGDGNTQEFSVQLPHTFTHVYSAARGYNVTAAARPPCEGGRHTARLEVEAGGGGAAAPRVSGLTVRQTPGTPGAATIQVAGNGTCSYLLEYGDGNNERRNSALPDRVRHVFPAGGTFVVVATAESPCRGRVQDTLTIARSGGAIEKVVISPTRARARASVNVTIEGRGTCKVFVDFGDGNEQTVQGQLPSRISHTFARPGRYEVFVWTEAPCSGDASGVVQIDR